MKKNKSYIIGRISSGILACGILSSGVAALITSPVSVSAQNEGARVLYIEPLFEYVTAPDSMQNLDERSEYVVTHFWDRMDFTSRKAIDQNALNHAFEVYVSAMPFSDRDVVHKSVRRLLDSMKGNSVLTLQLTKAAEESLYGPRAGMWSDEVYIPFLKAVIADKGIAQQRKERYGMQLDILQKTAPGKRAPKFRYRTAKGNYADFQPDTEYTILEFGDPGCDDCHFARLKMEMASDLANLIEAKRVKVYFIVPDVDPDEERETLESLAEYPSAWTSGVGYGVDNLYDIRMTPSFYLLGNKGEIIVKNTDVSGMLDALRDKIAGQK